MRAGLKRIWRQVLTALVLLVAIPALHPVAAQEISGAGLPEFRAALSQWLKGDEETALASLRDLAHEHNLAAQTLLAIIDKSGSLQGPYLYSLPRTERIALLRAEGGISGQNWIHTAAKDVPLAQSLNALWSVESDKSLAHEFILAGEDRAARATLLVLAARQEKGFSDTFRAQDWYPESLLHLAGPYLPDSVTADSLHPGHPVRAMLGLPLPKDALSQWLGQSPLALPLRGACARHCPETAGTCALALYHALDNYHVLLTLGSPLAKLVSEADFAQSPRNAEAVARRIMLNHTARTRESVLQKIVKMDVCTATWLGDEFARYTYRTRLPIKAAE